MLKNNYHLELRSALSLQTGMHLPAIDFDIDSSQIFMFSAITWNRHKIHYDQVQAKKEGHQDVLVQRGLLGNLFTRFINSLFLDVFIEQLDWKVFNGATPSDILSCSGEIKSVQNQDGITQKVTLILSLVNQDQLLISEATVVIRNIKKTDLVCPLNQF